MQVTKTRPIDDLIFECSRELFAAYGLTVDPRAQSEFPSPERFAVCGVMGFGGKQLRGALVLASTPEPLESTNPGGRTSQRDWICELANQLMGRVKNRLLARNVEILLATPAGLTGSNLTPLPSKLGDPQVFAAGDGYVCVWIDCEAADGFELPAGTIPPNIALPEGETVLF